MKILRNLQPPAPPPPATYTIADLSEEEAAAIVAALADTPPTFRGRDNMAVYRAVYRRLQEAGHRNPYGDEKD